MLKLVEVVILVGAGLCFVVWQFRDLKRAREIMRMADEARRQKAMQGDAESPVERDRDGR